MAAVCKSQEPLRQQKRERQENLFFFININGKSIFLLFPLSLSLFSLCRTISKGTKKKEKREGNSRKKTNRLGSLSPVQPSSSFAKLYFNWKLPFL